MHFWFERAPYKLIIVIICVECGAEECGANFGAVVVSIPFVFQFHKVRTC